MAASATIFAASASSWLEDFSLTGLAVENLLKSETRIYIRNSFLGRIQIANMCMLIIVVMPILFREDNNILYTRISFRKNNVLCNCNFWLRELTCCRILGITPCEIYLVRSWIIILRIHGLNLPLLPTVDHGNYLARGGNKRKYFHWLFPVWFQEEVTICPFEEQVDKQFTVRRINSRKKKIIVVHGNQCVWETQVISKFKSGAQIIIHIFFEKSRTLGDFI